MFKGMKLLFSIVILTLALSCSSATNKDGEMKKAL